VVDAVIEQAIADGIRRLRTESGRTTIVVTSSRAFSPPTGSYSTARSTVPAPTVTSSRGTPSPGPGDAMTYIDERITAPVASPVWRP
jgi:hypothetical protein